MPQYQDEYEEDGPISSSLRAICSFLGFVSFVLTCFVLGAPYWRVTTSWDSAAAYTNIWEFEGLFLSCVKSGAQKQSQCFQLQTLMMQPGMNGYDDYLKSIYTYLNAFRAFMVIALLCSMAGVVCSALGMKCAHALREDSKGKRWVVIIGGVCHMVAGTLTGISVSWYAAEVVREYYNPYYQTQKLRYTLGICLYLGWVSMLFSLIAGCLMACCTCFSQPADKETYTYKPPVSSGQGFSSYPAPTAAYKPSSEPYKARDDSYKYRSNDRYSSRHQTSQKSSRHDRQVDYV